MRYRFLIIPVTVTTVILSAWSLRPAEAASTLVKGTGSAVYLIVGRARYVFPSAGVYASWFSDFSAVKGVTEEVLAKYPIGGSVIYRPGVRLLKLVSDPKVYVIEPGGVLRWIPSEAVAISLYGPAWIERLDVLDDAFFAAYRVGEPLSMGEFPDGYAARDATTGTPYLLWSGEKRALKSDVLSGLQLSQTDLPSANLSQVPEGATIGRSSTIVSVMNDPLQRRYGGGQKTDVMGEPLSVETILDRGERGANIMRFALWVRETTSIKELVMQVKASKEGDADRDADGLVYHTDAGAPRGNLEHLRLVRRGNPEPLFPQVELATDPSGDGSQVIVFKGQALLRPGRHVLALVADVNGEVGLNQGFSAALALDRSTFVVGNTETQRMTPRTLSGPTVYTRTGTLALSLGAESKGVRVIGGGLEEVEPTVFRIKNPRSEPVTLAQIKVFGYVDEGEGNPDFHRGSDEDDGSSTSVSDIIAEVWLVPLAAPEKARSLTPQGNGEVFFVDLNWVIPPKATYDMALRVLPRRGIPKETGSDRVAFDIEDAARDILAYDAGRSQVEVIGRAPNGGTSPKSGVRFVAGGTLKVASKSPAAGTVFSGARDVGIYTLEFTGSSEEDIVIDELAFDLGDAAAARSVDQVFLNYSTESGWERVEILENRSGYVFEKLGLLVPRAAKSEATVLVRIKDIDDGSVAGDKIGFTFIPTSLKGKGKASLRVFDRATLGNAWTSTATAGGMLTLAESALRVSASAATPLRQQTANTQSPVLRVRMQVSGNEEPVVERLWVRVQATDTGEDGADLLEALVENPDMLKMLRTDNNHVVARAAEVVVYDASARAAVSDVSAYESGPGDYVKISFEPDQLRLNDAVQEFLFVLDATALAESPADVQAILLGGEDFTWRTSSASSETQTGADVSRLPIPGPTIRFIQ
ncbi:hypothetical protein HYW18_01620 [Candidatus Uhrbacteria bacterium]|nr:hypothetical protein [Candidatus Uhrbacteria bacterium]